mgnify:CR=1 FL=1
MDFLIFYEHDVRELDSVFLLRNALILAGYSCEITSHCLWGYWRHILFSKPKVVVVPWLRYDENIALFTSFVRTKVCKIVNLQWEQIYNKKNLELGLTSIHGESINAVHLCWGQHTYDRLKKDVDENKLKICGPIQFDFCRLPSSFYMSREELSKEFNLDLSKSWRLFISSFSYATLPDSDLKNIQDNFGDISPFVLCSKESRTIILKWYRKLLSLDSDSLIIYRPHPSELQDEEILQMSLDFKNFKIIREYPIKHWIFNSDYIDTWYSTSIAEVYFMNKKCSILRPIPIPNEFEVEIMKEADFVTTEYQFLSTTNNKKISFPVKDSVFDVYFDVKKGCPSVLRVRDALVNILHDSSLDYDFSGIEVKNRSTIFKYTLLSFLGDLICLIRLSFPLPRNLKRVNSFNLIRNSLFADKESYSKRILKYWGLESIVNIS